uniref:WW domain-containing protein n=1 Tax=Plectus sambesii TaxID=2011161 RepID=A0A914WNM9_9BILA
MTVRRAEEVAATLYRANSGGHYFFNCGELLPSDWAVGRRPKKNAGYFLGSGSGLMKRQRPPERKTAGTGGEAASKQKETRGGGTPRVQPSAGTPQDQSLRSPAAPGRQQTFSDAPQGDAARPTGATATTSVYLTGEQRDAEPNQRPDRLDIAFDDESIRRQTVFSRRRPQ